LFKEFGGNYVFTAAAYNSGAPAIKRFLGRENSGADEAVEDIAYNEGRNYCRKVLGHMMTYMVLHRTKEERAAIMPQLIPSQVPRKFPGRINF
jgi:peptidoglycan lytic transglycosylase